MSDSNRQIGCAMNARRNGPTVEVKSPKATKGWARNPYVRRFLIRFDRSPVTEHPFISGPPGDCALHAHVNLRLPFAPGTEGTRNYLGGERAAVGPKNSSIQFFKMWPRPHPAKVLDCAEKRDIRRQRRQRSKEERFRRLPQG